MIRGWGGIFVLLGGGGGFVQDIRWKMNENGRLMSIDRHLGAGKQNRANYQGPSYSPTSHPPSPTVSHRLPPALDIQHSQQSTSLMTISFWTNKKKKKKKKKKKNLNRLM